MDLQDARSILVVKPSSLGDVVHTLPVLPVLKQAFPDKPIRWLVNPEWEPLLQGHPALHETVVFPRGEFRGAMGTVRFGRWVRELRSLEVEVPEVAIDFQGLLRSGFIPRARGCAAVHGYSDAREGSSVFYARRLAPPSPATHAVDRNLGLLEALGLKVPRTPQFILPSANLEEAGIVLPERFVLLHPFARGTGKALSPESCAQLVERLAPANVVIVGRSRDPLPGDGDRVVDLVNRTSLPQLAEVCRRSGAIISMDSGPMHIASAVAGDRVLGIHTWTDTRKVGPHHPEARVWKAHRIADRLDFSEEELRSGATPNEADVEAIAQWALAKGNW